MLATVRSVAALLLSYGLLLLANGLFGTLLAVRTKLEGFPTELVGLIVAGYFVGLLAGARFGIGVVASVGHIRAFAAFASLMSTTALLHALWVHPIAWMAMRTLAGFCMAGMIMVTESWLHERSTNRTRGQVLSFYMITNYACAGCGQLLLPLADPGGFRLFSLASIVFSLALVPVLLTRAEAPLPSRPQPMDFRALYRVSPLGLVGAFSAGLVNASFFGLGPVFATGIGLSIAATSAFMSAVILGGLLLQWPVGRLSDRLDRRWILAGVSLLTAAASLAIFAAVARPEPWLFVAAVAYGSLSFTVYSLSAAHTNDFADPSLRVQTASGLLFAFGLGAIAGPLVASAVMGQAGARMLFLYTAIVSATLGVFAVYRMRRRGVRRGAEKQPFVAVPGAQFTSKELYAAARDHQDRDLAHMHGLRRRR